MICGAKRETDQPCRTDDEDLLHEDCIDPTNILASNSVCRDGKCAVVSCQSSEDCPPKSMCYISNTANLFSEKEGGASSSCMKMSKLGQPCFNSEQCINDLLCQSETGDDAHNTCKHRAKIGEYCEETADGETSCELGLACAEAQCEEKGKDGAACTLHDKKTGESTCSEGMVCVDFDAQHGEPITQCVKQSGKGEECKKMYQCADGLACQMNPTKDEAHTCIVKSAMFRSVASSQKLASNPIKDKYQLAYDKAFGVTDPL